MFLTLSNFADIVADVAGSGAAATETTASISLRVGAMAMVHPEKVKVVVHVARDG